MSRTPHTRPARGRYILAGLIAGVFLAGSPLSAANREHQQMMADIRMLQEQNAQLQQTLGTLMEALKVVTSKIDEQTGAGRKLAADQKLLIDGLANELRIVREKVDDTNVRLGSIAQEVDALRNSIPTMPVYTPAPPTDPGAEPAPTDPDAQAQPAPGPAPNPVAGMSPSRLWDLAFSDYAAGQWALAIQGFETYLRAFPRTEQSDNAQFYIAESYQLDGKMKEALAAYERVIAEYPQGDRVPDAYYKRGVILGSLNQPDRARESFETVIKNYPTSEARRLAEQRLKQLPPR